MDTTQEPQAPATAPIEGGPVQVVAAQLTSENGDAQLSIPTSTDDISKTTEPDNTNDVNAAAESAATPSAAAAAPGTPGTPGTPLSKNAQKKLKRKQKWEDGRDDRKRKRKEKRVIKAEKKKAAKAEDGAVEAPVAVAAPKEHTLVPVSFIFDCAFENLMRETEQISLSSQITRSYAANRTASRCARIYASSWGGMLQSRYETLLANQHKRWSHVHFLADDFVAAAKQAEIDMQGENGGKIVDVLEAKDGEQEALKKDDEPISRKDAKKEAKKDDDEKIDDNEVTPADGPKVIYLTSDSPYTLTRLEPNTSYVIGGIVDKNREKGLCYKRARQHGIRTAKLPIGNYMVMASRKVLTTNHVVEIMLNWLETGDWATAFSNVIPKRKGGQLKGDGSEKSVNGGEEAAEGEAEEVEEDEEAEEKAANESAMDLEDNAEVAQPQAETETVVTESAA
ncbi:tRNA (guanine(9)-N(1))-methyltransferase [Sporothrix stenoceras]|uniref:tRNA (guanine(9)-N1)-methyltransferase n=1 Tax=Sporothrix stenoceras TaxID=5173 RepID=A0ABR3ZH55_9PEZI